MVGIMNMYICYLYTTKAPDEEGNQVVQRGVLRGYIAREVALAPEEVGKSLWCLRAGSTKEYNLVLGPKDALEAPLLGEDGYPLDTEVGCLHVGKVSVIEATTREGVKWYYLSGAMTLGGTLYALQVRQSRPEYLASKPNAAPFYGRGNVAPSHTPEALQLA